MGIFKHMKDEIDEREKREGITLAELLDLSPPLRRLMNRVTRHGELSAEDASEDLDMPVEETREMLKSLVEKGYLLREKKEGIWMYRVHFAKKRGTSLAPGIWSALDGKPQEDGET
jgi:hypothetical protein